MYFHGVYGKHLITEHEQRLFVIDYITNAMALRILNWKSIGGFCTRLIEFNWCKLLRLSLPHSKSSHYLINVLTQPIAVDKTRQNAKSYGIEGAKLSAHE